MENADHMSLISMKKKIHSYLKISHYFNTNHPKINLNARTLNKL